MYKVGNGIEFKFYRISEDHRGNVITVCEMYSDNRKIGEAKAKPHPNGIDSFNRKNGRRIALVKLLNDLGFDRKQKLQMLNKIENEYPNW